MSAAIDFQKRQSLQSLTKEIHDLEVELLACGELFKEGARKWGWTAIQLGYKLRAIKDAVGHGFFQTWVENNCKFAWRTAKLYKQMADVYDASEEGQRIALLESGSIKAFLALVKPDDEKPAVESKKWAPDIDAIGKIVNLTSHFLKYPIASYPPESVEELRSDLEPIARQLWPERF